MAIELLLKDVNKRFGNMTVLENISVKFESGKIHGIIGRNGSGKTVLFKCICGLISDYTGRIEINGWERKTIPLGKLNIGMIIETPGFLAGYSGYENLRFLANIQGKIKKNKIYEMMRFVGLDPAMRKSVDKYSLGMKQRLGMAQALMEDPELLVLDEPFNGLDNSGVKEMRKVLKELKAQGKTILIASHNMTDIDELCDTRCELDAGKFVSF